MVVSYPDVAGKRKTKWFSTGLPIKGNKKKAEQMLMDLRKEYVPKEKPLEQTILFSDFMLQWLEIVKPTIAITTYSSYCNMVTGVIVPYFKAKQITLGDLKATDIQVFYMDQLKRVSASSVIHYHANIHKALKYAVKIDLIPTNPADKVERPKKSRFVGSFYDSEEVERLFVAAKGTNLEIPIFLGAFYGLRRSEALANGVPMKQIQEWLGHSDFSTTANVYAHLDYNSKLSSADAIANGLKGALTAIQ